MKLLYCPNCKDVIRLLFQEKRYCRCKESWGMYEDELNAVYYNGIPLAFQNQSFVNALARRPEKGKGRPFEAFVVPKHCDTFKLVQ